MVDSYKSWSTLPEVLASQSSRAKSVFYYRPGDEELSVSYAQLHDRARLLLYHMQARGAAPGEQMIILMNDNQQFVEAFWACILGGIIPVPVAVGISDEQRHKLFRIFAKLQNPHLYTSHDLFERLGAFASKNDLQQEYRELRKRTILTDSLHATEARGELAAVAPDDTAFIQFSSGSTSEPKGVVLTHANMLANIRDIIDTARFTPADVSLSWMPLTHDMGLIGFHINMLCAGMDHCLMETDLFIRRPLLWIELASRKRATVLCSPNFGYRHFLKMFDKRGLPGDIDLSSVRLIFNGAEPISAELCSEFMEKLERYGLRREAMFPVYGLAEATLAVSFPAVNSELELRSLDRSAVTVGSKALSCADPERGLTVVSVGRPIGHCEVKIVDERGVELPEDTIGKITIRGPNVTSGYYLAPDINSEAFIEEGWLDTGDLGFKSGGQLYITGRLKDVIFTHGQNLYAHDLESIIQRTLGLELGKVVAAAVPVAGSDHEQVVIFVLYRGDLGTFSSVQDDIVRTLSESVGVSVADVVPVKNIPKTTSGKIQRFVLAQSYAGGGFDEVRAQLRSTARNDEQITGASNEVEAELQEICDQVLGQQRLGKTDNFFELGTNSLKLIEVHAMIDSRYPGMIEITDMFDYPTIELLAGYIAAKRQPPVSAVS